jgi:hypothetical protein
MWTAARSLAALEGRLPETLRVDVEFRAPIPLPSTVEFLDDAASAAALDFAVRGVRPGRDGRPSLHLLGSVSGL